jgi:spore maturation protein CgeB
MHTGRVGEATKSGMRILIVDTFYAPVLEGAYASDRDLASSSYDNQWRALMGTFFGTADAYSHYLGEAGHVAHELIVNCSQLQQAWLREQVPRLASRVTLRGEAIVRAQIDEFDPDVVYVQNLHALSERALRRLGRDRLLVGQIASELPRASRLCRFDLIVTSFPHYVNRLQELGVPAEYLPLAFDPRVLEHLDRRDPALGAVFVGSLQRSQHSGGNSLLERAAHRIEIDFWGHGEEDWPRESPLRQRFHGPAWGLEMYRVFARARIVVNRHIDVAEAHANNMRLFEATGVGTLLLTDAKTDLDRLFVPGKEIVSYANEDELVERGRYYLGHDEERLQIAADGQRRTLAEHGYDRRMKELAAILEARRAAKSAGA